ncbi:YbaK/EbsC family protein [Burkholderiaceae bacterium FT117]|uniref:aminoacyl-tRNA deacylase n=1 Tax=Zeimonas sediminis TaxID=2944268 RepID=UPI002342F1E6|nr:YbaK/EbsC family protein [Zeimonas sediminis]MCM5569447.1 YbaK/EbsC family protein [Zeimonas sediminis]
MTISARLSRYLDQRGARYQVSTHDRSSSSAETARTARIAPHLLAKSVVLEDERGWVVAVVPADSRLMIGRLSELLGRDRLRLADESRIAMLFEGCEPGAVPPVGMAWGLETVVDDELDRVDLVYMEGGDHECLLSMSRREFRDLMSEARHGRFSRPTRH